MLSISDLQQLKETVVITVGKPHRPRVDVAVLVPIAVYEEWSSLISQIKTSADDVLEKCMKRRAEIENAKGGVGYKTVFEERKPS